MCESRQTDYSNQNSYCTSKSQTGGEYVIPFGIYYDTNSAEAKQLRYTNYKTCCSTDLGFLGGGGSRMFGDDCNLGTPCRTDTECRNSISSQNMYASLGINYCRYSIRGSPLSQWEKIKTKFPTTTSYQNAEAICNKLNLDLATVTSVQDEKSLSKFLFTAKHLVPDLYGKEYGKENSWFWTGHQNSVKLNKTSDTYVNGGTPNESPNWNDRPAWERSDGIGRGSSGEYKTAPSYEILRYGTVVKDGDFSNFDDDKCTALLDYPQNINNGSSSNCNSNPQSDDGTITEQTWTCASGYAPIGWNKCKTVREPAGESCKTKGYTCFPGGTSSIWVENDYFLFHTKDQLQNDWKWDIQLPPIHDGSKLYGYGKQYGWVKSNYKENKVWNWGMYNADIVVKTLSDTVTFKDLPGPMVLCRERSVFSDHCTISTEGKCINKYAKCNAAQTEHFNWLGDQYKHKLALPGSDYVPASLYRTGGIAVHSLRMISTKKLNDPTTPLCFGSWNGNYTDWTALQYFQGSSSLITGLVFGYFTLFLTSLLACQMAFFTTNGGTTTTGGESKAVSNRFSKGLSFFST